LHNKDQDKVELEEVTNTFLEANGPEKHQVLEHGYEQQDGKLSNELAECVYPDVVHIRGSFSQEDGFLTLENNDGGLEVGEHLDNGREVDRTD